MNAVVENKSSVIHQEISLDHSLESLLAALHWHGNPRILKEALPHYTNIYTISMFCDVMRHLNYDYSVTRAKLDDIDPRLFPCLFISNKGVTKILLEKNEKSLRLFDSETNKELNIDIQEIKLAKINGTVYVFKPLSEHTVYTRTHWLLKLAKENKKSIYTALILSFCLNLLALAVPLFVMLVYDRVIGTASIAVLLKFSIGIGLALLGLFAIHRIRALLMSLMSARIDKEVGNKIFERLLYLAPSYTESATIGAQVARIRDFDRLRELFNSVLLGVFFDVPFVLISLLFVAILGGSLIVIPVVMMVLFIILTLVTIIQLKRKLAISSKDHSRQQEFLLETIHTLPSIKYSALIEKWNQRYRDLSAESVLANLRVIMIDAVNNAISNIIVYGNGLAVIAAGAVQVMDTTLSVGAMIAVMMIIWRVLTPLKSLFNTLPRLLQMYTSFQQINRLMKIPTEIESSVVAKRDKKILKGNISFDRVSMRYSGFYQPALIGLDFAIQQGELVGIVGRNGSGKSTLLKLILNLYQPQAGSIRIDNNDIRHIDPVHLRNSIAYLPQKSELFYGTIADNLRLANPTATDDELHQAARWSGILDDILQLSKGFDTRIRDHSIEQLAGSFQQKLCLARTYLKQASIILLDEPNSMLDMAADEKIIDSIISLRGKSTILMVTHRPSHLKKMDKIFVLDRGQLILHGPANEVLQKLPKEML